MWMMALKVLNSVWLGITGLDLAGVCIYFLGNFTFAAYSSTGKWLRKCVWKNV